MLAVAAPGSPLTSPPTPCAPHHTTPPLAAAAAGAGGGGCGGGSVGVVACVATWSTHWLCWCCPRPCHSHTHTHGVVGTWWWWLCVCGVAATTTVPHSHQPPPLCPLPRPVRCVCACAWWHQAQRRTVVAPTLVCVCGCVCAVPTTPTTHAVHPCRLSLLALPIPHLPLSLTWHASRHTHTWRALCASSHPLTHTLAASLPTRPTHTHATGCACAHPPALIRHHSHTRDAQAWRMHGWLGVWSPPPRPLCPPLTHTHTAGLVVGAMVVRGGVGVGCVCLPRHQPPRHPSHHHHQRSCAITAHTHTHTRDLVDAPLPHTHATCTTTLTNACCVVPTPCHSHTPPATHTPTMVLAIAHHAVHSHPTHATHTHTTQVRDQGHAHQWVWPLVSHHHHAGLGLSLCCVGGFLSTNPFSLSLIHPLPPPHPPTTTTIPSHPSRVCGVGKDSTRHHSGGEARHSHACCALCPWLTPSHPSSTTHPPSCAFPTTNHHPFPLLHPPSPSHTHHKATVVIHCPLFCLTHTHMVWVACGFVAALSCCVCE